MIHVQTWIVSVIVDILGYSCGYAEVFVDIWEYASVFVDIWESEEVFVDIWEYAEVFVRIWEHV